MNEDELSHFLHTSSDMYSSSAHRRRTLHDRSNRKMNPAGQVQEASDVEPASRVSESSTQGVQEAARGTDEYVPGAHAAHVSLAAKLDVPSGQSSHETPPESDL